ncbi:MAG: clostripain-related cysteine peptidase [Promethearchaeota archaeon]
MKFNRAIILKVLIILFSLSINLSLSAIGVINDADLNKVNENKEDKEDNNYSEIVMNAPSLNLNDCNDKTSLSTLSIGGINKNNPFTNLELPKASATKEWTLILYKDADNNLEKYGLMDFNELEAGLTDDANINILVLLDLESTHKTNVFYITHDTNTSQISSTRVELNEELNMGDPNTLKSFINFCANNYPANRYWLDLWDHGGNYLGIAWDDSSNDDHLTMEELRDAIQYSLIPKFDIISADACLMGSIEVAYQLRDLTDYYIASPETIPAYGYPYDTIVSYIVNNPFYSTQSIANIIVDKYFEFYSGSRARSETLAIYDMTQINTIITAISNLANSMMEHMASGGGTKQIMEAWWNTEIYTLMEWLDLYDFCDNLKDSFGNGIVYQNATNLQSIFSTFVIYAKHNPGHPNSHGLSISFPFIKATMRPQYNKLDILSAFTWDEFLNDYFSRGGGGMLSYKELVIDDSAGNNNQIIDPGEQISLNIKLYNGGLINIPAPINVTISTNSSFVIISDDFANYSAPAIKGGTILGQDTFLLSVNSSAPVGILVPLSLHIRTIYGDYFQSIVFSIGSTEVSGGNSFDNATLINIPSTIRGTLPSAGKNGELYLKFTLNESIAPKDLTAELQHGSSPIDFDMDIYDENFNLLASAMSVSSPDTITAFLQTEGTYYIVLYIFNSSANPQNKGNFTLTLSLSNSSFKRGESIKYSIYISKSPITGYLPGPSPFGSIFYRVYLRAHTKYTIFLKAEGDVDFDLFVYNSTGDEIAYTNEKGTDENVTFTTGEEGSYFIEVWRYKGEGEFTLEIPGYGEGFKIPTWIWIVLIVIIALVVILALTGHLKDFLNILSAFIAVFLKSAPKEETHETDRGQKGDKRSGKSEGSVSSAAGRHKRKYRRGIKKPRYCYKCKARLGHDQVICPKCGSKNPL